MFKFDTEISSSKVGFNGRGAGYDLLCHCALRWIGGTDLAERRLEEGLPRVQQNRLTLATRRDEDRAVLV
jgi:hypothetical protein